MLLNKDIGMGADGILESKVRSGNTGSLAVARRSAERSGYVLPSPGIFELGSAVPAILLFIDRYSDCIGLSKFLSQTQAFQFILFCRLFSSPSPARDLCSVIFHNPDDKRWLVSFGAF
jgi:hypothetical protein